MASAIGIGGLFFRATDPAAVAAWYARHLGIDLEAGGGTWEQAAGPTVFAPFPRDSTYFAADKPYMLNLRIDDLPGLIAQLREAGVPVETRAEWDADPSYGRFARIHDPEGNPIELWQPPAG